MDNSFTFKFFWFNSKRFALSFFDKKITKNEMKDCGVVQHNDD